MKFYQACFGKPNNVNWSLFNMTEGIPANFSSFYEKIENSNTPQNMNNEDMLDRNREPICMFEIVSREDIVSVSKIQYGTKDNMGRPKMFAHGFLCSTEEDVLRDPNNIISLANSNFKFEIDETKNTSVDLIYDKKFTLTDAMSQCNLTTEALYKLMTCVYFSLTSATDFPIYIISTRKNEITKPLIYCIYSLLPYSLRYALSFSDANNFSRAQFKNIMFVEKKYADSYYFDMDSFETNINIDEVRNNMDKYPFLAKLESVGIDSYSDYCDKLQEVLNNMQLSHSQDYNVVKLADIILNGIHIIDAMSEQDLTRFLLEILSYAPLQNNYIDSFVAEILVEYFNRGITPNEVFMKRLLVRAEKTPSQSFNNVYKQLQMKVLIQNGPVNVVIFLEQQRRMGFERFRDWCQYIVNIPNGNSLIEQYYLKQISDCNSFERIRIVFEEIGKQTNMAPFYAVINSKCFNIAKSLLRQTDNGTGECSEILEEYANTYSSINVNKSKTELNQNINQLLDDYWMQFDLRTFEFSEKKINNYQCMEKEDNTFYRSLKSLIDLYNYLEKSAFFYTSDTLLPEVEKIMNGIEKESGYTYSNLEIIAPVVQKYIISKLQQHTNRHFIFWYKVASFGYEATGINPYKNLLRWQLPVIVDDERYASAIVKSERVRRNITKLIDPLEGNDRYSRGFIDDFDNKSDEHKLLKKRLNVMLEVENEIDKKNEKAQKALEKSRKEEEKQRAKLEKRQREDSDDSEYEDENIRGSRSKSRENERKGFTFPNLFGGNSKKRK